MTTKERDNYIISAAVDNAYTTVVTERAADRRDIGRIAADSVSEVILANVWRVSAAKRQWLEREAAHTAETMVSFS